MVDQFVSGINTMIHSSKYVVRTAFPSSFKARANRFFVL